MGHMEGDTCYSIGDLARHTGVAVKTIRFYSDRGILPPTGRSPAGYRRYGRDAVARLELVRTLRDLGLDLAAIRQVIDRELPLPEVAAAHAEALAAQIRVLRLRRAVMTAIATRGSTPEEIRLMHTLAKLSEAERHQLTSDFLDAVFGTPGTGTALAGIMRTMTPELPEEPGSEQVQAWVELAELSQQAEFRALMRDMAQEQAAENIDKDTPGPRRDLLATVRDQVAPALAADIPPAAPLADTVVAALTAHYAALLGRPDDAGLRQRLLTRLERANDPRRERYVQLLAVINDWSPPERLTPVLDWSAQALRARVPR